MIIPKLGLSKRLRFPVFYIAYQDYTPQRAIQVAWNARSWSMKRLSADIFLISNRKLGVQLKVRENYVSMILREWPTIWERHYLPNFSLEGKTVLDVGAGCGETAAFYLLHGARKIIAIECEPKIIEILRNNVTERSLNVEIIPERFEINVLRRIDFDFMKIDIEGEEKRLLELERLPCPCIVETHDDTVRDELNRRFGMKVLMVERSVSLLGWRN